MFSSTTCVIECVARLFVTLFIVHVCFVVRKRRSIIPNQACQASIAVDARDGVMMVLARFFCGKSAKGSRLYEALMACHDSVSAMKTFCHVLVPLFIIFF